MSIKISFIVAMAQNGCIGKDNQMPWHISDDLKRFKTLTTGHPVIMGRKTFESILGYLKKPLPNRSNIIISRSNFKTAHDVSILPNINAAIKCGKSIAKAQGKGEIFIMGGAQIYTQSINLIDKMHITQVHKEIDGDAYFPEYDINEWTEIDRIDNHEHNPPYSFITLERR